MRKIYILLATLAATAPAHAGLVIEPEPAPAYIPYAPVAPVAAPTPTPVAGPATSAPSQGTLQQFLAQPVVSPQAPQQATPATTKPVPGDDQARKLLAEDAAKVIHQTPAKDAATTNNKQLDKGVAAPAAAKTEDRQATHAPVETDAAKTPVAENKSDVVEVKPTPASETEPLPSWSASAGTTLRQTIQDWSHREGWEVRWESELLDYPIEQTFSMVGKYLDVVTRTFELYKDAKRPFKVEVYPSQKLVVVKEKK